MSTESKLTHSRQTSLIDKATEPDFTQTHYEKAELSDITRSPVHVNSHAKQELQIRGIRPLSAKAPLIPPTTAGYLLQRVANRIKTTSTSN